MRPVPVTAHVHPDQPAGPALAQPVDTSHVIHRPTPNHGPQNFPEAISFKAALSSIASASSFFSLRFSSSRDRNRLASDTCIPPYRLRQLYNVASLIPC